MKSFNVVYRYGKLYDRDTNKRILISEEAEFGLFIEEYKLLSVDPYNKPTPPRDAEQLYKEIQEKKYYSFKKIAERGDTLEFTIKAGRAKGQTKYKVQCTFTLRLLEELYMFKKENTTASAVVYGCNCVVDAVRGDQLSGFEPIYAYSLNDAYMKTYDFYFALYGKPTANIYNEFDLINGMGRTPLRQLRTINSPVLTLG
ncbi:hypothetical protein [Flavisolibacter tropicus]|uniref:Uncharacterized protein n=1 Tax=Flavisolibacter tropicus TaxID=1492898 RepID=A0A172TUF7_9BACT|nr:hypothetical protein [Flavisolibacter tropicus]ANE50632.1 hypothetical protein SY85_09085 [Flavisolibacter tropicus]